MARKAGMHGGLTIRTLETVHMLQQAEKAFTT